MSPTARDTICAMRSTPQAQGGVGMGAFAAIRGGHREDGALVSQQPGVDGQHHLRRVRELLRRDVSQPIIQPRGEPTSKAVRHLSDSLFRRATGGAVFFCHPAPIGASDSHNLRLRAAGRHSPPPNRRRRGLIIFLWKFVFRENYPTFAPATEFIGHARSRERFALSLHCIGRKRESN